ncbi:hypothetical protein NDU88_004655 [Pleurodeles waltl]|uniref:Uncharacterized protein n=1 Tax=Pleurodeles waltl TaxID=8319 RepID=A0AAV7TT28_PLEWA|nr:hypothetical protein NDU88_004655 [Pleurodeles waltl]
MPPSPTVPHTLRLCGRRLCRPAPQDAAFTKGASHTAAKRRPLPAQLKRLHRRSPNLGDLATCGAPTEEVRTAAQLKRLHRRSDLATCSKSSPQLLNEDSGTR